MAVYKVLQIFRDIETKEVYEAGQEIELTVKRAEEATKRLKVYKGEFLERIDIKEDEKEAAAAAGADEKVAAAEEKTEKQEKAEAKK